MRKTHNSHATHQLVFRTQTVMSYVVFVRLAEADKIKRNINRAYKLAKRAICRRNLVDILVIAVRMAGKE